MGIRTLRRSLLFYALSCILDEVSTFVNLAMGGVELNPRVAWMISVHPLLYVLCDMAIFLLFCTLDRLLRDRVWKISLIWALAGSARLIAFAWNYIQLWGYGFVIHNLF
jgi:hypothetical protein